MEWNWEQVYDDLVRQDGYSDIEARRYINNQQIFNENLGCL